MHHSLSLFFPFNSCCFARYEADVFISLSERKCLQLWQVPPEPVALLVSMVVLQAAPWADCAQGPLQPVFFFFSFHDMQPRSGRQNYKPNSESTAIHSLQVPHSLSEAMPTKFHLNKMPLFLNYCYAGAFIKIKQPPSAHSIFLTSLHKEAIS